MNPYKVVFLVILSIVLLLPMVTRAQQAPDADAVAPVFAPADYGGTSYTGYVADRMDVNLVKRLLAIDVDALLLPYTNRPGSQEWIGEHIGKFLHAGSYMYRLTGDERLRERLDYAVETLLSTQLPNGYLGTYLEENYWTSWDVWAHKYNLIGLLAYYKATGNEAALEAARKIGNLLCDTFGVGKRDIISSGHHVGMAPTSVLEPMVILYRLTGEQRYLDFCFYILDAWEQPDGPKILSGLLDHGKVNRIANAKAYEMLSNLVGLMELYRVTGRDDYLKAVRNAWTDVMENRHYLTGSTSFAEYFRDDHDLPGEGVYDMARYVAPGEGCVTVTWLQLNIHLLHVTGEMKYADELERITYNALFGAQSPQNGGICYFLSLNGRKRYGLGAPRDISCCASSIPRGIALIPEFTSGTLRGEPAILQYTAGRHALAFEKDGRRIPVQVDLETRFPEDGNVLLTVSPREEGTFTLNLRIPSWTDRFVAEVGGETFTGESGEMVQIRRSWKAGDRVTIDIGMPVRLVENPDRNDDRIAVQRGPQLLALDDHVSAVRRAPLGWWGNQIYAVKGNRDGEPVEYVLVPFAEAGQTWADYKVLFPPFTLTSSEVVPAVGN